ncbi:cAMP and cAMP-inhibited cGMP 3',5'-cyclic phosphodiesterase 10A-like [Mya arenaria]|uniref:cAMP and cAMP-inhibited cGMP 3',5'-cyclic phosphodiesterase 10A-like n=1 Tax=Mya arenaria TaxID=6604 RepID=UPI0022E2E23E|nr:cAMP and cAMP-inhibited cGMP 3',5'-cyclic phosphodiesterase 10A-like [Mya arenaria]
MSSPANNMYVGKRIPHRSQFRSSERWRSRYPDDAMAANQVREFLARYPAVLEEYLDETASVDYLEQLLQRKRTLPSTVAKCTFNQRADSNGLGMVYSEIGIEQLARRIVECSSDSDICAKMHEICGVVANIIFADIYNLYYLDDTNSEMSLYMPGSTTEWKRVGPTGLKLTVSAHVATTAKSVNVADLQQDSRFPKGVRLGEERVHHVIGVPILLDTGRCYAVVEFSRGWDHDPFSKVEFEVTNAILSWVSACVQKMKRNKLLNIQTRLHGFLLETTRVMFDDVVNVDLVVTNIMTFTKELVSADRCGLLLVDEERKELFADYFDEGATDEEGRPVYTKASQIRFSINKGISGYVARTGQTVNIRDAYSDKRFNPEVDQKTGYRTRNILCMPIQGKNGVIGVVQLINRLNGRCFTADDEDAFSMFAVYSALALHYARVYNVILHQQTKFKVAMEVLEYHCTCSEDETAALYDNAHLPVDQVPLDFYTFDFNCNKKNSVILPQLYIKLMYEHFGKKEFDLLALCRFVLTVKKNYRPVPYHNWEHGFQVAHCLWRMVSESQEVQFSRLEKMGMIVGGICHDLDHRGFSNEFFRKTRQPLAALYSTSIMEQHHYKQTVTILSAEGHDIFSHLTSEQYKQLLAYIRDNILATDLALYFGNQKTICGLLDSEKFSLSEVDHRRALMSLMMTGADLCAITKPWETQRGMVDALYEEFYMQGDKEKNRGMQPMPMMDRLNWDDIPNQQIGFINFICKPLYSTLIRLIPETKPLQTGCDVCKEQWQMVISEKEARKKTLNTRAVDREL